MTTSIRATATASKGRHPKATIRPNEITIDTDILDDARLDRFRPSRNVRSLYRSRTLPGGVSDIDLLTAYWNRRQGGYSQNVGLVGDTQSGKTMLVEVMSYVLADILGAAKPLPIFTISGTSSITDHELFGQYRPVEVDGAEKLVWMEGLVALACRFGGILYLDEVNALPGNVTSALHSVLDDRRQFVNARHPHVDEYGVYSPEVVNVSRNLWCVCTFNPGYAGMSRTNEAFINRFQLLEWGYDDDVEKHLIASRTVRMLGQALRKARDHKAITTPVGTTALQRFESDACDFSIETAIWTFLGQFSNPSERMRVDAIITDLGFRELLSVEANERPTITTRKRK